jgi:hypothetical protein
MGGGVRALMRRKQVDSVRARAAGAHQLRKELSVLQLIAIGPDLSSSCYYFFLSLSPLPELGGSFGGSIWDPGVCESASSDARFVLGSCVLSFKTAGSALESVGFLPSR